jgi:uncharacterized heparinase superfamily protein
VLAVDGRRVVVDTGTSTYEPGARRQYERSTRAHNTVEVDGVDQTEVWATFRAARRARPAVEHAAVEGDQVVVVAAHDGYERLAGRPRHQRRWEVSPSTIRIVDTVSGTGHHRAVARLHLPDDGHTRQVLRVETDPAASESSERRSTGFGDAGDCAVLESAVEGTLPLTVRTTLTLAPPGAASAAEPLS